MTGELEEFLRKEPVPQYWELISGHCTIKQIDAYNKAFERRHPEVSKAFEDILGQLKGKTLYSGWSNQPDRVPGATDIPRTHETIELPYEQTR